jgi:hypothetical protein
MRVVKQEILKDHYKNIQLVVTTEEDRHYISVFTNTFGFQEITREEYLKLRQK